MMASKLPCVVPTRFRLGLVHGLSWIGLAAPTTLWLRATFPFSIILPPPLAVTTRHPTSIATGPLLSTTTTPSFLLHYSLHSSSVPSLFFIILPPSTLFAPNHHPQLPTKLLYLTATNGTPIRIDALKQKFVHGS
ncbi:hypothetical protein TIFTF001_017584 [Ficus carica]|uniref:Uncharacterized protein n=1 Tax=Ficus carica TaxID=3494 RepID=A0AA88D751_FICCA|nr:hypothetical protein TIFTF001_017584 [Ficus carica]